MYSKITDSFFDIFDRETGLYMGHSHFTLTEGSEKKLLDFLNYNKVPDSLVLLNVSLSDTSSNYIPPELFQKHSRTSVMLIDVVDTYSQRLIPIEIEMSYDVLVRGNLSDTPYFFESVELRNIKILDVDYRFIQ
ncbi:hypothetical protein [Oscillibacter sp.]|uniref:hypothetical protein n=1 Tax=Oscillibacter sp. TaxID=1945593 RepID=UPI00289E4BE6|nr:hypothetical protein [Oscillibacter sp.]